MKLQIIVGSNRPNRVSDRVGQWVLAEAKKLEGVHAELTDLADFELPLFDEPMSPRYNPQREPSAAAQAWLDRLASADGYVIVTPEYNHSVPGVLKNALDYIVHEFTKKPVAIVSHGTVGGARAAEQLKLILIELKAAVVPEAVALVGRPRDLMDESGVLAGPHHPYGPQDALAQTLAQLAWWSRTLAAGRSAQ